MNCNYVDWICLENMSVKKDQDETIKMDGVIWAVARIDRVE